MSFLGRARKALGDWGAKELGPQYYDVACPEGHRLSGERLETYQALRCPACGLGVFILPKSLLPEPPRPATKAAPKLDEELGARISRRLDEDPEELVDAPAAPELPDPSERG